MLTKSVIRATTATHAGCVQRGMCQTTPFSGRGSRNAAEDDPRHNILHLNTEGLTDNKISVIEQLGYKNKAFIIVLVLGTVSYIYEFYIICVTET